MNALLLALYIVALPLMLSIVSYFLMKPDWEEPLKWGKINVYAGLGGLTTGTAAAALTGWVAVPQVMAVTLVGWLSIIVFITDYSVYKIPRGPSRLVRYVALIPLAVVVFQTGSWESVIVSAALLVIPLLFAFSNGLGFGDVRLMIFASIALPWWTTAYTFIIGLLLACLIQGITFLLAGILKRGQSIEYTKGKIIRPIGKLFGKDIPLKTVKKRATPFGPALMISYLGISFYTLVVLGAELPLSTVALF